MGYSMIQLKERTLKVGVNKKYISVIYIYNFILQTQDPDRKVHITYYKRGTHKHTNINTYRHTDYHI